MTSGWPATSRHSWCDTLIRDKVLFGTDYPVSTPERWLEDLAKLEVKPEVRPLILKDDAVRLLGL